MKKVAVVDGNIDNRLLLQAILVDGYEVREYQNGVEALTGFEEDIPDLVVMDISLPRMDGIEVLRRMRARPELESLPVVALTNHHSLGERERCLSYGFDEYVAKPIVHQLILKAAVHRALTRRSPVRNGH